MTLKRLLIVVAVLAVLAGGGLTWLGFVAYTPQGRARIIITQLKGDTASLRGWLLEHHVVRPGFSATPAQDTSKLIWNWTQDPKFAKAADVAAAADEMFKLGPDVMPVVMEALRDDSREVRMMAIRVCGKFGEASVIHLIVECMLDATRRDANGEMDTYTQSLCAGSLIDIGPSAYGPLMKASELCDPIVREVLAETLAEKLGTGAVPYLMQLLDDHDYGVSASAAVELGKLEDPHVTDTLIRRLSDSDEMVRSKAGQALGRINDSRAIPGIMKMLTDTHIDMAFRVSAAVALAQMGMDEGPQFILSLVKSANPRDRAIAAKTLSENQINGRTEPLLSLLADSDGKVRLAAVQAVGGLCDRRAIPGLTKLLADPDHAIRKHAATALNDLGITLPPDSQPGKT